MTIGLVTDPCNPYKPGGLGRCIFELAKGLVAALPADSQVTVYSKSGFPIAGVAVKALPRYVWLMGARVLDPSFDVYVFFTPVIPLFFRPKRSVVVVEDLAYLELPRRSLKEKIVGYMSYRMHKRSLRLADTVACISEATAVSVERYFGIPKESCVIAPLAAMPLAAPSGTLPPLPPHFFVFAGVVKERKNVANIVRAFARYAPSDPSRDLVIAGSAVGAYGEMVRALAAELGVKDRAHFIGHMNDGQMAALYQEADALVFVSKVEGFGMPVLEAFIAGVPVITASTGATAEVAGGAALLADPDSPGDIAAAMERLAKDPALGRTLVMAGRERAKAFSWAESGRTLARAALSLARAGS